MAKRTDLNQKEIVQAFRKCGCTVQHLHTIGKGCPDIMVGFKGINLLVEIKNGNKPLTDAEEMWHTSWAGQVAIIRTCSEIEQLLNSKRVIR